MTRPQKNGIMIIHEPSGAPYRPHGMRAPTPLPHPLLEHKSCGAAARRSRREFAMTPHNKRFRCLIVRLMVDFTIRKTRDTAGFVARLWSLQIPLLTSR
jgi:hypothetical protein